MNTDNYPLGAANDPAAPYNEPLREGRTVQFSATIDATVTVDVYPDDDETEVKNEIGKMLESSLRDRFGKSLFIDNIELIDE